MDLISGVVKQFLDIKDFKSLRATLDILGLEVKDFIEDSSSVTLNLGGKNPSTNAGDNDQNRQSQDTQESEQVFVIETLANRGDHLSQYNICRELAAKLDMELKAPFIFDSPIQDNPSLVDSISPNTLTLGIWEIETEPFKVSDLKLPSTFRLNLDTHPLVLLCNYVMKELGQPMHCYSANSVQPPFGSVELEGVNFRGLDGVDRLISVNSIFIVDSNMLNLSSGGTVRRPVALAGIIGSDNSKAQLGDFHIFLESACFNPTKVRKTRLASGINSDAAFYFERGVDWNLQELAVRRFLGILQQSGISFAVKGGWLAKQNNLNEPSVSLSKQALLRQLGENGVQKSVYEKLQRLGFSFDPETLESEGVAEVKAPSRLWFVIERAQDVIQEIMRIIDVNKIKRPELSFKMNPGRSPVIWQIGERCRAYLNAAGFTEIITRSFYGPREYELLTGLGLDVSNVIRVRNSCERQYAYLKTNNVLHIANCLIHNLNHFVDCPKVYDLSRTFDKFAGEFEVLSGGFSFPVVELSSFRNCHDANLDFLVNTVLGLCKWLRLPEPVLVHSVDTLFDFCANVMVGDTVVGRYGVIKAEIVAQLDGKKPLGYFEFFLSELERVCLANSATQSRIAGSAFVNGDFPPTYRDLNLELNSSINLGKIIRDLRDLFPLLVDVKVIDRYEVSSDASSQSSKGIEGVTHRLTLRFLFQSSEKSLSGDEVDSIFAQIADHVKNQTSSQN